VEGGREDCGRARFRLPGRGISFARRRYQAERLPPRRAKREMAPRFREGVKRMVRSMATTQRKKKPATARKKTVGTRKYSPAASENLREEASVC
jgi:hypothetical protein